MGLDIYLYPAADHEAQATYYAASDKAWEGLDYEKLTDEEKAAIRDSLPPQVAHADVPSENHPDHLCNRRYLRSSYNSGGFNHAAPQMLATVGGTEYPHAEGSLYWIFEPVRAHFGEDPYEMKLSAEHVPAINEARKRALDTAERLRAVDPLRVCTVSANMFSAPPTAGEADALRFATDAIAKVSAFGDDGWSSRDGDFFGRNGLTILAAVPGIDAFNKPAVHLVHRLVPDVHMHYVGTAEIVAEFCDEALALIEKDGAAVMSWSG